MLVRFVLASAPCLAVLAGTAGAQSVLFTLEGDQPDDWFGYAVASAGDVDGDGHDDFIAGAANEHAQGMFSGSARLWSGRSGLLIRRVIGSPGDYLGTSVSGAGDVNGDGYADYVIGARSEIQNQLRVGSAHVYSGVDGTLLHQFWGGNDGDEFGISVAGAGDVDADGYADILVGAWRDGTAGWGAGSASVFSGFDGSLLRRHLGVSSLDAFGYSVAGPGDVDGDGHDDVLVGAHSTDASGSQSGSAYVFSGADGSLLHRFDGDSPNDFAGYSVAGAGDVDADGHADLIVGAFGDAYNGPATGMATVYSGLTGASVHTFRGSELQSFFGFSVSGAGDVDRDGHDDLIVGSHQEGGAGAARVFSGRSGVLLQHIVGETVGDLFGYSVSAAGDVDADGFDDVAVGAYKADANGHDSGSLRVYSNRPETGFGYCHGDSSGAACPCGNETSSNADAGCANSTGNGATLRGVGEPTLSQDEVLLTARGLVPGAPGAFVRGSVAETTGLSFGDGLRCVGGQLTVVSFVSGDDRGVARYPEPYDLPLAQQSGVNTPHAVHYQFLYRNVVGPCGAGFNATNGYTVPWRP